MNRRTFLKLTGAGLLTSLAVSPLRAGASAAPVRKKPNVILVLCDDLGWGDLGAFWQNQRAAAGKPHIDTPNLDAAMTRGVMLTNAYTAAPVCAPARASMVTGKHQGHCNLRDNTFDCPIAADLTIGTVMQQAGYATWHIGKWGIGGGYQGRGTKRIAMACDAGFDYSYGYPAHLHGHSFYHYEGDMNQFRNESPVVENISQAVHADPVLKKRYSLSAPVAGTDYVQDPEGTYYRRLISNDEVQYCYDTDLFTAKIKQLIAMQQEERPGQPFFCYACYTAVHGAGHNAGADDKTQKDRSNFHVPAGPYPAIDESDRIWGGGVTWEKTGDRLAFKGTAESANTYIHPDYQNYTPSQKRYATNVTRLDEALGDLLHFLKVRGLEEETLFIFTSDNGPAGEYLTPAGLTWVDDEKGTGFDSNAHFKGMKRWSYEGGLREPTFALWPKTIPASGTAVPRTSDHPFQFPAWMATLADVAGLPQPAHCDGVSILPALLGRGNQLPARIYAEYTDGGSGKGFGFEQMVRDGDYVLIRNRGAQGTAELYNVVADPEQQVNLAGAKEQAGRLVYMTDLLLQCRIPVGKTPAACGAPGGYSSSTPIDTLPIPPSLAFFKDDARFGSLYTDGADSWPWVPNFATMTPSRRLIIAKDEAVMPHLPADGAYGFALHGRIDVEQEQEVTFTARGPGGCQLWLAEAHILEYEAGDCVNGRAITLKLAPGKHVYKLYLTTTAGPAGLCTVTAGDTLLV